MSGRLQSQAAEAQVAPVLLDANGENHQNILLIAAHPDDETIGAGALLARARNARVAHVTDGSPLDISDAMAAGCGSRQEYAAERMREVAGALSEAGIAETRITRMHFTDQRVSFAMAELALQVVSLIERERPEILLTHAYEGGHPDHDGVALACHVARWIQARRLGEGPKLIEFAGYHASGIGGAMRTGEFLPRDPRAEWKFELDAADSMRKERMLRSFATQARTLQVFFPPMAETFRLAPRYDFGQAPHAGTLFYENFSWGIDGERWRRLAAEALGQFGIARERV